MHTCVWYLAPETTLPRPQKSPSQLIPVFVSPLPGILIKTVLAGADTLNKGNHTAYTLVCEFFVHGEIHTRCCINDGSFILVSV
jgi:hypothetical protein